MPANTHPELRHNRITIPSYSTRRPRPQQKNATTLTERMLLMTTIALLPLQAYLPKISGFSILFLLFGGLFAYLFLFRRSCLGQAARHPVFLAGMALVLIAFLMETLHNSQAYYAVIRTGLMLQGGITIAALCRDQKALWAAMYGIVIAGVIIATVLFSTTYGVLSMGNATTFQEADQLRNQAFSDNVLQEDLNMIAFFVAQGAIVAFAIALSSPAMKKFYIFLAISAFCSIGALLPLSRGALVILMVSGFAVAYTYGLMKPRLLAVIAILSVALMVWVPDAIIARFSIQTETRNDGVYRDGRSRVYNAMVTHLPDYIMTGVGIKHFYGSWGRQSAFLNPRGASVTGAHNCFAQIAIYWGIAALLALCRMVWKLYRCLPTTPRKDPLRLCIIGIATAVLLQSMTIHNIEGKQFSVALGLIIGSSIWLWPRRRPGHLQFHDTTSSRRYAPLSSPPMSMGTSNSTPGNQHSHYP